MQPVKRLSLHDQAACCGRLAACIGSHNSPKHPTIRNVVIRNLIGSSRSVGIYPRLRYVCSPAYLALDLKVDRSKYR